MNLDTSNYESWVDADHKEHREYIEKIKGSFDLKFSSEADYSSFLNLINSAQDHEKIIPVHVYVVNRDIYKSIRAFYKFNPKVEKNLASGKRIDKFKFEIEEQ